MDIVIDTNSEDSYSMRLEITTGWRPFAPRTDALEVVSVAENLGKCGGILWHAVFVAEDDIRLVY